ncbi:MAG TPA: CRISPR-associated endonuclease Cas2 [Opitutales bacterium]|nr:CRISPR-associated endonuclease Cas2 [Opitutales bacterium]
MYILVTYDVSTVTPEGQRRLRRVAKTCLNFGQRVQNSVFECKVDPAQFVQLKHELTTLVDPETDSLRFYHLGNNWHHRVEHYGAKKGYDIDGYLGV